MENFPQHLSELRKRLGLTQEQLGGKLGISSNYVSLLEGGKKNPSTHLIMALAHLESSYEAGREPAGALPERGPVDSMLREDPPEYAARRATMIPVVGWAHAGKAASYEEIPPSWGNKVPTECRDVKAFAVRLEGDSMEGDGLSFREGDLLVVMPSEEPYSGCMVVAKFKDDGVTFRRVEMAAGEITLVPLNPRYEVTKHAVEEFAWIYPVWGRWTQLWKR